MNLVYKYLMQMLKCVLIVLKASIFIRLLMISFMLLNMRFFLIMKLRMVIIICLFFFFCFYYESIKIDQVYVVKKVMIENNGFMVVDNIIEFILFYSCFKGMYIGKV